MRDALEDEHVSVDDLRGDQRAPIRSDLRVDEPGDFRGDRDLDALGSGGLSWPDEARVTNAFLVAGM